MLFKVFFKTRFSSCDKLEVFKTSSFFVTTTLNFSDLEINLLSVIFDSGNCANYFFSRFAKAALDIFFEMSVFVEDAYWI